MNRKLIFAAIGFLITVALGLHFYVEWQIARFDASLPEVPAEDTAGGHWHGDEWHADDAHAQDDWQPSVDWQQHIELRELVKPENLGALDADDPVARAWAKLDELAENRFAWGGNTHPQTDELIVQLEWPPPPAMENEEHAMDLSFVIMDLAKLRDPNSIEALVAYQCDSGMSSGPATQTLIALGPPVVPHLIPYLDEALKEKRGSKGVLKAARILSAIGTQHRAELDGIVEHIILPRFEQLFAEGFLSSYKQRRVKVAIAALKR